MTNDIDSYSALGRLLGVSRQAATKLAMSDAWPFAPAPPWPASLAPRIAAHVAARRADNNNAAGHGGGAVSLAVQAAELGMSMDALLQLHDAIDRDDWQAASDILDAATDWDAIESLLD